MLDKLLEAANSPKIQPGDFHELVKTLKKKQSTRHPVYNCRLQFKKGLASELGNDPQAAIKCVNRFPRCIFVTFCAGTMTAPSRCCKTSQ